MPFLSPIDLQPDFAACHDFDGISHSLIVPLGFDWESDRAWSLLVSLDPTAAGRDELTFCLLASDAAGGATRHLDSAEIAVRLSAEDRACIRHVLIAGILWLVSLAMPERLFWSTLQPLPPKALTKFLLIGQAVRRCGYAVSEPIIWQGRHSWRADRPPPTMH